MKKTGILVLCVCLLLAGCAPAGAPSAEKLQIVATLFPQYDFARQICGDRAEITLLLPPGAESHAYEPTPADMIKISDADLFIYTGAYMEPWAARLTVAADKTTVVDASANIQLRTEAHDEFDPHIWTDPQNAITMLETICAAVCEKDGENAATYRENADRYKAELTALDNAFAEAIANGARREIVFGGHFAMEYFAARYDLECHAAYDSCSGETEPAANVVAHLVEEIKAKNIPVVYYEELSTPRIAQLIADETGAKMLLLHSCHNVAKEDMDETYLSLMRQNLENLKVGLN